MIQKQIQFMIFCVGLAGLMVQNLHAKTQTIDATELEFCQIIEIAQNFHLTAVSEDQLKTLLPASSEIQSLDCHAIYQKLKIAAEEKKIDPESFILERLASFISSLDKHSKYIWQKDAIENLSQFENDYELIENKIGYAKIRQFHKETFKEFLENYKNWEKEKSVESLVLDLRSSVGGDPFSAIRLLEIMMDVDTLFLAKTRNELHVVSDEREKIINASMVVLVDENTKSAAELMASLLQYHKRAKVVGEKTFGKDRVQTGWIFNYPWNDTARMLLLTTAQTLLPDGSTYDKRGVIPDFLIGDLPQDIPQLIQRLHSLNLI